MGFRQFTNSLNSILGNPHINRGKGIVRHLHWQYLKAFNRFPLELDISRSRIIAAHKRCGVSALIYSQHLYDYNNMKLLQLLLDDGGVFFDVGANIGSYSLIASEQETVEVVAFEPHPMTFGLLQANVQRNQRRNVRLFNVALGSGNGTMELTNVPGSAMNHRTVRKTEGSVPVQCLRADSVCQEIDRVPTVVKIDVEGFEYDVLEGFGEQLRSIETIFIEMNGLSDERSGGEKEIHRLLVANQFTGPMFCDFDRRTLTSIKRGSEDAVYIGVDGMEALRRREIQLMDIRS